MPSAAVLLAEDKLRGASRREVACRTTSLRDALRERGSKLRAASGREVRALRR
ncbi:hypothetical protein [Nostoc sp.]|uniref:hypothetical protein n=1 Tax=Nostoc sp. TaxID=1180 RepID=UPI002FFC2A85